MLFLLGSHHERYNEVAVYVADVQSGSIRTTEQSDKPGLQALYYWQHNESTCPSVAPLAVDVLPMPASEAYVERVFSVCGSVCWQEKQAVKEYGASSVLKDE